VLAKLTDLVDKIPTLNRTQASAFHHHFRELDNLLAGWHWLWREVPFKQPQRSWYDRHPHWRDILRDIDRKGVGDNCQSITFR
jgi:hypothetical protein